MIQQTSSTPRSSPSRTRTQSVLLYGRFPDRMGSQLAEASNLRKMVSSETASTYINWLQWGPQWRNQTVRVYCDNSTAVAFIRKQGGTHSISLFHKTMGLFHLLDQFVIILIPTHFPGARNALSRRNSPSPTEWLLQAETLRNLFCVFGTPLMDMFARAGNKVTLIYVSPYPDDRAWAVDTLSISWGDLGLIYAFPPAPIVPPTLDRIRSSHGTTVILIASQHPSRPWHPLLLQLSLRPHIQSPEVELYQYVPNLRRPQFHWDPRQLDLVAWLLSGNSSESIYCGPHGTTI